MALKLYNSQSRKLEEFVPLKPGHVSMYVCGPTVYDLLHVGNFRGPVFFNMVRNWLEHSGYKVTYALNFTDVDDKIINRANEKGMDSAALAEQFVEAYKQDFFSLGLKKHELNPKVTETMNEIIQMVQDLIDKKSAYATQGDVMFSIKSFPSYGKLSGRNPDDLLSGARVEVDEKKQNPLDFALWKAAKPGEPSWQAPWGAGRPGWHIECSAMIKKHFGEQIDIHGGGSDLIFPHHENEIAQSEACTGKDFVKYWLHVGMLNFGGQKMSKSVGNIVSLRSFVEHYNSEIYKWLILSVHYRSVSDFGDEAISRAIKGLARIYSAMSVAESVIEAGQGVSSQVDAAFAKSCEATWAQFTDSLNDDFGTPNAFAAIFDLVRTFNAQVKRGAKVTPIVLFKAQAFLKVMKDVSSITALFGENATQFLRKLDDMLLVELKLERSAVDAVIAERVEARNQKDFKKSDELRDKLQAMGISVMDTPQGVVWEVLK